MSENIKQVDQKTGKTIPQHKQAPMPKVTKDQLKQIEASFIKTYGKSYNRMRKAELAVMVANQSTNFKNVIMEAQKVSQIGLIMQRQRDVFRNLLRRKAGLPEIKKKSLTVVRDSDGNIINPKK
ncbi:MAG: hypothetical protein ACE5H1_11635 [Thermodesulfobacteriota bacterium]